MLQRTKYIKSEEYTKYKSNLNSSFPSSKFHHKKKSGLGKKSSNPWKRQNTSKNWNKENDQNYLNYDYYYPPKEKKEKNNYYNSSKYNNKYYQKKEKNENKENFEKNKNDKKMSFDNDATTQSNSSTYEHEKENEDFSEINKNSNNNELVLCKNKEIKYCKEFQINNENEVINNKQYNNIINKDFDNINNIIINGFKNLNLNSNSNSAIIINKKRQKNQKKKKQIFPEIKKSYSDNLNNLNEPYNKFNSINNNVSQNMNPLLENTEILKIKVKIQKDKYAVFKLRRFDDLFLTVKLFCEINLIEEKLIKPIITMVLCGLNSIYQIYNSKLEMNNIKILRMIKNLGSVDI